MLPPAVGAFENPRSSRELISQPPGAPDAREPVGPTQLRQCGDARRLIAIAINECEKSGHYRPLPPPQDRCRIRAQHEHIKNVTTHPALTGEGGSLKASGQAPGAPAPSGHAWRFSAASTPAFAREDFPTPELPSKTGSRPGAVASAESTSTVSGPPAEEIGAVLFLHRGEAAVR